MTDNNNTAVQAAPEQTPVGENTKKQMILLWILSFFFWFIPAIVFYFTSKEDKELHEEVRKVLNVQIFAAVVYIVSLVLCAVLIGIVGVFFWLVYNYGNLVVGLIAAANGKSYKPWIYAPNWIKA